jgi:hypothetical protein
VNYSPDELGAMGPPPPDEEVVSSVLGKSLLDRAGLERRNNEKEDN